jgi:hypothetical protein
LFVRGAGLLSGAGGLLDLHYAASRRRLQPRFAFSLRVTGSRWAGLTHPRLLHRWSIVQPVRDSADDFLVGDPMGVGELGAVPQGAVAVVVLGA